MPLRTLGATKIGPSRWRFRVWAPKHEHLTLLAGEDELPAEPSDDGHHEVEVDDLEPGARYAWRIGDDERPDPASLHQPDGVHARSAVVDTSFTWTDDGWRGIPLRDYVIYEMHVGTFIRAGTFDAAIPELDRLAGLGITAVELMPLAQFPGDRNWGYDGTFPYAVQESYGGPAGMHRFVDAAHQRGLAVVVDVVYNHLGPEGNYLGVYGDYFTDRYQTPWGMAMNFDGPGSDHVREYFIQNALMWIDEYHVDGLRFDAVHAIVDHTAIPFLQELTMRVHAAAEELGREVVLIAESDLNDPRMIRPVSDHGIGMDAQWADDLHHALHALLTGESDGYYGDYGSVGDLAEVMRHGFLYRGQVSKYRNRRYGADPAGLPARKFVVCSQNHDQVGNRMTGDRLTESLDAAALRTAAAAVILAPFTPMLFMGEEYGERNPFQYFISHGDEALVEAVRKGRAEEFSAFRWRGEVPDPYANETFERSKLTPQSDWSEEQKALHDWYRRLLELRRSDQALRSNDLGAVETASDELLRAVTVLRRSGERELLMLFTFAGGKSGSMKVPQGRWTRVEAADDGWPATADGEVKAGGRTSFALYERSRS